jgi:hypothetical protein
VEKNIVCRRRSIDLDVDRGMVVLDIDNQGLICYIKALNRDDVYESLKLLGDSAWADHQD